MIARTDEVVSSEEEIILPPLRIYNQNRLINKVNQYLAGKEHLQWNKNGYCHGLVVLWQQKMADYQEQQYYSIIKKIIHTHADNLEVLNDDIGVQKFIAQVEYAQNPDIYSFGKEIRQIDVDIILESDREYYKKSWFSIHSFAKLLDEQAKTRVSVTISSDASWHTIGIYFRDDKYYLFDPNYETGEAKEFDTAISAATEMMRCLYNSFKLTPPQWTQDLNIMMLNPMPSKLSIQQQLLSRCSSTFFQKINLTHPLQVQSEEISATKPVKCC